MMKMMINCFKFIVFSSWYVLFVIKVNQFLHILSCIWKCTCIGLLVFKAVSCHPILSPHQHVQNMNILHSHIIRAWYFITHITWKCMYIYIVFLYSHTVVSGMREVPCKTIDEVLYCLQHGSAARQTGSTQMNEHSSRSHSVFTVNLGQYYE